MGPYDIQQQPKASKNLMQQQSFMNKATGVAGGVLGLYGQGAAMMDQANSINTTATGSTLDAYGRPQYNLGNFAIQTGAIKPQGASGGEILSGVGEGAAAGAAFGPIGAAVGGVVGGISNAITGGARKRAQTKKKRLAEMNLRLAQNNFNTGMEAFNNQQAAQGQYNDMTNPETRINTINSYNSPQAG